MAIQENAIWLTQRPFDIPKSHARDLGPVPLDLHLVYIDDIVIFSKSYDEHLEHLGRVLQLVEESHLTLLPNKCHFMYTSILLLGQKVSRLGLSTHQEKVEAVIDLLPPHNIQSLHAFLGMVVYFSHYIPYFSDLASPLFVLLKKDSQFRWNELHQRAFEELKRALAEAPLLAHPIAGSPYRLYSNASDVAIGVACVATSPTHRPPGFKRNKVVREHSESTC